MIIDVHAHVIPRELTRDAAPSEDWRPRVFRDGNAQVIEFGGKRITAAVDEIVDVETILDIQSRRGIDHVLLCPWVNLLRPEADAAEAARTCDVLNEAMAGVASRQEGRVSVLGAVPLQDAEAAARVLEDVMRLPGMRGVEITASVGGAYVGHDRFRPFWETAEETGALVFIHPTTRGFDQPVFNEFYLWNTVGNPMETTIAASQMVVAGVMESHPRLRVLLAHGGGAVLALRGRLRRAQTAVPTARRGLSETPDASLRRFFYDTVTHDTDLLRSLVAFAGADRVLLGSDYPFDMGADDPVGFVASAGLAAEVTARVLGGTAAELLGVAARSPA